MTFSGADNPVLLEDTEEFWRGAVLAVKKEETMTNYNNSATIIRLSSY